MHASYLALVHLLLLATSNAIENWNTEGISVSPVVVCPGEKIELVVDATAVSSTHSGIRVEDQIPLREEDYARLIEKARKIANKADEEDDADLEESTRAKIRSLKKAKRNLEKGEDQQKKGGAFCGPSCEPTVYKKEGLAWSVMKQWSVDLLANKYSDILLSRSTSVQMENGGTGWNEVEMADFLNSSFRQQKMKVTDYEDLLLAESAPKVKDSSEEAKRDPQKFLESVEKTALEVFVDYDSWDNLENPEGEMAQGRLRQIQSLLLKDQNFQTSFLYKLAKLKDPAPTFTIAPPGSGTTFNQTQGRFIAVVQGSLRVFLYPPSTLPPHTFPQKASIAEWIEHIYPGVQGNPSLAPMEVTLRPGNVLHIPSGYHVASLACSESMFFTLWDEEKKSIYKTLMEVQINLQRAASRIREANVAETKERDEAGRKDNGGQKSEQEENVLEDLSARQDEVLKKTSEEGLAKLMKLLKRNPNRPDILLVASTFEMLNYNHAIALQLVNKVIEMTPGHSAGYLAKLQILTNKLNYLMQEVDLKDPDDDDAEVGGEQGDADPSDEQLEDMVEAASSIAESIKKLLKIDEALRWAVPSDFVAAYSGLSLLELAIGKKRVREAVGAPDIDSADSTDPYFLELMVDED